MKRIRSLLLLGAIATALVVPTVAKATGGTEPANSVYIVSPAQYNFAGTYITIQLYVRCKPTALVNSTVVNVTVDQPYPETPVPTGAHGSDFANVVCDNRTHTVGVTVPVGPFDAGKAYVKAELVQLTGNKAKASRWIDIVANG
jgi:hypothetical protein